MLLSTSVFLAKDPYDRILVHVDTQSHTQNIKGHHRWHTLPLTPKEDMSYPAACLSILPSHNPLCQTATEQIIQSVSSPWWPDLSHTRTSPGCRSEGIEMFIGFLRWSFYHLNQSLTSCFGYSFGPWIAHTIMCQAASDKLKHGNVKKHQTASEQLFSFFFCMFLK